MFALQAQTAAPPLGPPLVALAVLVVVGVVVGVVASAVVRRLSNPVGKYRLLYAGVILPVALAAYGLLARTHVPPDGVFGYRIEDLFGPELDGERI